MADRVPGLTYTAVFKGINLLLQEDSNIVTDIVGHGGIGKSQLVRELAASNGFPFFEITCSLLQPGDLTMPVPKEDRIDYYLNPQVQGAVDAAKAHPDKKVILFLDEFNRPIAMVQGELMNLVLQRNLMGIDLPDNVVIITAENPSSDVEGFEGSSYATNARDMAINDRTMRIRMGTTLDQWLASFAQVDHPQRSGQARIHPLISDFLQAEGRQYFIVIDETRDKNPTPRAYERLSELFYNYEDAGYDLLDLADDDLLAFLIEGIDGCIGEEAGQVFLSYLQTHQGDYIKAQEVVEAEGDHLDPAILDRYQAMQAIRKKRVIEDLTAYLLDHENLLEDQALLSRYLDLFLATEADEVYSLVKRLNEAAADSAMGRLNEALSQFEAYVDRAFEITMAVSKN
ncbi:MULTISPECIES: AAA family ATPase [Aerococcus]|uniref:AAA family ATPase n=1 Tax=Aerococcus sanguinicola TaxID=119206 RepID=A0A5N1GLU5_9LACT|nr:MULTISPECIES: AAA family ATPase [Aerococcus]KAA9301947.1 AAA family ATPase [Aerococcus sanguinicola]MDK6368629.1 AAA family ATPase [Aerococcus sp. UMB9870]MDK6679712.1 AAA family ATPase [Aerococcus sp. UMB8608]MDK6686016.1 AAA family ATPase [Aerococcus sp. UMB8623]MDK6940822.1 AAA family ATPase [Aerococcus sp. UMB8487]